MRVQHRSPGWPTCRGLTRNEFAIPFGERYPGGRP